MTGTNVASAFHALWSQGGKDNPYPNYTALRDASPVLTVGPRRAIVTGYPECEQIVLQPRNFRVCDAEWGDHAWPSWRAHPSVASLYNALMHQNAPANQPARRLLTRYFAPKYVAAMRAVVERHVNHYVDLLVERAQADGEADAADTLLRLPAAIVCDVLGAPQGDVVLLRRWIESIGQANEFNPPGYGLETADADALEFKDYLRALAAQRRKGDESLTAVLSRSWTGDEDALLDTLVFVAGAGTETAASMLGSGLEVIAEQPSLLPWLRRHSQAGTAFGREVLRYHPPAQYIGRWTTQPVTLGTVRLPSHTLLMVCLGAAGRDPRIFHDPDRFQPSRYLDDGNSPHQLLSFGLGSHHCPGASLAEMIAELAFVHLARRCRRVTVTAAPERTAGPVIRGFTRLPVHITPTASSASQR
ncbi:cytochrome P450 [Streptomyces sp. NPDC055239]